MSHDEQCESEYERSATAWSPCNCSERAKRDREPCVFCGDKATRVNGLGEPVCADDTLRHWHDHDGSMHDRYADQDEVAAEYERNTF